MGHTFNRLLTGVSFAKADACTRRALGDSNLGVLNEIDVAATMQKMLDVEMTPYLTLGACKPKMAWQATLIEQRVGAMLPCNVILRAVDGGVEVSAIDPVALMRAIDISALRTVAGQVRNLPAKAVALI